MPLLDTAARAADVPELRLAHGTAFELVLSIILWVDEEEATAFPETRRWRDRFDERVAPDLDDLAREVVGDDGSGFGSLLAVPLDLTDASAALLPGHVEAMRPRDVVDVLGGDDAAVRARLQQRPAATTRRLLATLLRRWHAEVLAPDEAELGAELARTARAVGALARRLPVGDVVEWATNGARLGPLAGAPIVLVPTVVWRPWIVQAQWRGALVVAYPGTGDAPPATPESVARVYRALADESRLRILQELAKGDLVLNDLAEAAGVVKSTAHHHLVILRDASLVSPDLSDDRRYRLRRDVVETLGLPLRSLLERRDR